MEGGERRREDVRLHIREFMPKDIAAFSCAYICVCVCAYAVEN